MEDFTRTFGSYIKAHRKMMGYTQEQMGYYMCVSQSLISDWENDVSRPTRAQLALLDILLDISEEGFALYAAMTPMEEAAAREYMGVIDSLWARENLAEIESEDAEER